MSMFTCQKVYSGWPDVATPDDIDVTLQLDRTTHEFYPALRELVLLYDAIAHYRETEFVIGTADYVVVSDKNVPDGMIDLELPPVCFTAGRDNLVESLEALLTEIFEEKDQRSSPEEREREFELMQPWIDEHDGETDIQSLYSELMSEAEE